ncbi:MAG: Lrp/AsnC family transcriptional regulator [Rhodospirillaceae bacterium]
MHKRVHPVNRTGGGDASVAALAPVTLDGLDRAILQLLQSDASQTLGDMARTLGISQGQCWRKVDRLRQTGVIQGVVAQLDRYRLGLSVEAFVQVAIAINDINTQKQFCDSMRAVPEIVECYMISGEYNFLLRILVRDLSAYGRVIEQKILSQPGIAKISSAISTSRCKYSTELPVTFRAVGACSGEAAE